MFGSAMNSGPLQTPATTDLNARLSDEMTMASNDFCTVTV